MEIGGKVKENENFEGVNIPPYLQDVTACKSGAKGRVEFIDTAKGVCILLVVMFHTGIFSNQTPLLGMLRMPFYFTLAGIFFKDYGGFISTLVKKMNKLLIPFLFFFTMSYAIFVATRLIIGGEIDIPYHCFITSKTMVNIALWFLLALFSANLLFFLVLKINKKISYIGVACIIIATVALNIFNSNFYLPMYIDSGMAALPFLFFGYYLRQIRILNKSERDKKYYMAIPILIAIAVVVYIIGDEPYIGFRTLYSTGNQVCFYIGACSIVLAALLICKGIGSIPGIKYIGRYSIIILGMHITISSIADIIYKNVCGSTDYLTFNISIFLVTLCCSILCIPILTKYFPRFTAQKDLINISRKV